ncbi:dihydroxyacetone kinase subunit DhaL [Hoyosella sp. YIM 151337]|uniref:dihydroxyacetone kinase subunit DhaL n=1 Tax=Hoyosella sp. YIM 151337 TaxID=2992742 RepID=UPI00223681BD|nr:dihydroxyacetone kinase subunit DhaL [Hoyosella sp. YIM 151337]MCW4353662.1 dihydroxyacetone kinase subunit DhaL [Hoyosella sp. YIM 151337]
MTITVGQLHSWLRIFADLISEHTDELTQLDSAIGDADHGTNMQRGTAAVLAALDDNPPEDAAALFKQAGMALVSKVGGASGPLYGTFFIRAAASAGPVAELEPHDFAKLLRAGLEGVVARGKPDPGDKTMFDALSPAVEAADQTLDGGASLTDALAAAEAAANSGRDATIPMLARKGRASYLGERSIGHQDPGATSAALLITAAARALG